MSRVKKVSDSIVIAAPPETIYRNVSDPTQMGRWSPENVGATVRSEAKEGAYEGMTFDGHNKNNRRFRKPWNLAMPVWSTRCVVTAAEPGQRFAFKVIGQMMGGKEKPRLPFDIATWEYTFDEVEGGTRVTESWIDERDSTAFGRWSRRGDRMFTGASTFPQMQAKNIQTTLERLKQDMESSPAPS